MDRIVADHIRRALNKTNGKVEGQDGAARILGLHPSTLRGRMKKLGIPYGRNKK
jgi:transcriptional regulator with GAF, ATPase, and Fis domain